MMAKQDTFNVSVPHWSGTLWSDDTDYDRTNREYDINVVEFSFQIIQQTLPT